MEPSSERLDFVSSIEIGQPSRAVTSRVQARSFTAVQLNSHSESLRQFEQVFDDAGIRHLVKTICYDVLLPSTSDKRLQNKFQSTREAATNSAAFTRAVLALFTSLSSWQRKDSQGNEGIRLSLTATSPSEDIERRNGSVTVKRGRNFYRYLDIDAKLLPSGRLPSVACVSLAEPPAAYHMATVVPSLQHASCEFYMPKLHLSQTRQGFRAALAQTLLDPSFTSLATLEILLSDSDPENELAQPEEYVGDDGEDDLSRGLARISGLTTMTSITLRGKWILYPRAFPSQGFGPRLSFYFVEVSLVTPDGKWLFDDANPDYEASEPEDVTTSNEDGPADVDSEDSDAADSISRSLATANLDRPSKQVRGVPSPETFTPLVASFARAVAGADVPRRAEMHIHGVLAMVDVGYIGVGEEERTAFLNWPASARRAIKEGPVEKATWYLDASGEGSAVRWKLPAQIRAAMEDGVGEGNIKTSTPEGEMEME
ncbi:hypothetical protein CGRA01v4_12621 [Colletotrichum graminicola]|uniref:Uncharacterized protein n=1 Tax=Colletotrichum graminicola (strain M1.001 / M2 / FGSC 10212) TaxID=645133 RepID=E3QIJ5_COLGM|nr:uncharacterized protein GLRG_05749 [Colletotrichum graminicola M1.001]EFQ30605.1 hypothetical protein GLRG_05749 [Colletotrichum graminicola M1.001]WDK21331.1 hypothetical protein CGRA01v4_12621 [Colletotrichum graminicola]